MSRSLAAALLLTSTWIAAPQPISAQTTTRVSVDSSGTQASGSSTSPVVSADGRFVAFSSSAPDLVPGDTNSQADIFVRDLQTGTTVRVSVDSSGLQATGASTSPAINGNGQVVAFTSTAPNLVSGDTNGVEDIFVHDRLTGSTMRVSVSAAGVQSNGLSGAPWISTDGRFVAFHSSATNLVAGDTNAVADVFVRDLATGSITRVSVDASGSQANGSSTDASISADGRFVAFTSHASNLVVGDTNLCQDAFVYDRFLATVTRVSTSSSGSQGNNSTFAPRVSGNGTFVAFESYASNLVSGDSNGYGDIFLRDLSSGTISRVSVTFSGGEADGASTSPAISTDGQFVAYYSESTSIVPGGSGADIFVFDSWNGTVQRVSVGSGGLPSNGASGWTALPGDGSFVVYGSYATNLVRDDTNNSADIFLTDPSGPSSMQYCLGDGSATPCPCGNTSVTGAHAGCLNSTGEGAHLQATGIPSISSDTLVLMGSGMTNGPGLYFQGTAQFNSGLGAVLGDGLRCTGGTIIRLGIQPHVSGTSQYPGPGEPSVSVKGLCTVGAVRTYQIWYRDAASFCAPETYNLSNGLALAWRP